MLKYKINFKDLSAALSPWFFRAPIYLRYMFALVKPLDELNDNSIPIQFFDQKNPSLYQFTIFITRFLQVNASRLVLQKYLNELFDPTNEGILIVNNAVIDVTYRFNNSEQHDEDFDYNAWDITVDYAASGEFILAPDGNVYESKTTPNLGNEPPNGSFWDLISTAKEYSFNEADEYTADYTIKIPLIITTASNVDYSNEKFMAIVNQFNASGRTYQGIVLETSAFLFQNT